jgi:hypothetical protein
MSERQIAVKMLLQAVRDAQGDDPVRAAEARRWLQSAGADLAGRLGIPPDRVTSWTSQLPALPYEQLSLFEC